MPNPCAVSKLTFFRLFAPDRSNSSNHLGGHRHQAAASSRTRSAGIRCPTQSTANRPPQFAPTMDLSSHFKHPPVATGFYFANHGMRCSHLCSYTTMSLFLSSAESRYNQWVKEHYRFLMRSAWALTGSKVLAEDIVQDVYFLAWKHRKQLKDESLARAWLFRIMRRCVIRHAQPKPRNWTTKQTATLISSRRTATPVLIQFGPWPELHPFIAKCWCCITSMT